MNIDFVLNEQRAMLYAEKERHEQEIFRITSCEIHHDCVHCESQKSCFSELKEHQNMIIRINNTLNKINSFDSYLDDLWGA